MAKEMSVKILHVTKTTAQWAAETSVISKGLLCIEFTTDGKTLAKVGDGTSTYAALKYLSDGTVDITKYYTSEQTDAAIDTAISALGNVLTVKGVKATVDELPSADNAVGDLWFVGVAGDTADNFAEYVWTSAGAWEYLGCVQTNVDLEPYATIEYVDGKVTTINGRLDALEKDTHTHSNQGILDATTASYTTAEQTKLAGIAEGANKTVVDAALDSASANPVENKAVYTALDGKVDKVDGKALSTNDFTNELKTKLEGIAEGATSVTVDTALSADSTNPVENKAVHTALGNKVDKVEGMGLSANDFTDTLKTKLEGIETGATKTVIDATLSTSSENPVQNKAVKSALDAKVDVVDGMGLSTNDYTTAEKTKLAGIAEGANKTVVDAALSADSANPVENKAVKAALDTKVDAVTGKGLSANDFTNELKTKLEGIADGATNVVVDSALSADSSNPVENQAVKVALDEKVDKVTGKGLSTNDYTTDEKNKLAGIADGANKTIVDTALSSSSTNPVENKAVYTALDGKVDKVDGKGLSTNDYTTAEKEKLAGLSNYDDTALTERVAAIEADYIKSTDSLILNCTL